MTGKKTAVVFGYGDMGVRGLEIVREAGIDITLVVTHKDSPTEKIWFDSLERAALGLGIAVITPEDPKSPELFEAVQAMRPDYIFSFYYRFMLPKSVIEIPRYAFNMHGSLLPKYRGRAPTNWALVNGETETGATLHLMTAKADAGQILDQMAFAIGPNDNGQDVFVKTLEAAKQILRRSLPKIVSDTMELKPNPIEQGSYYGRRTPADGELKASMTTQQWHNLIRAVAPPFPGAFVNVLGGGKLFIYRTLLEETVLGTPEGTVIFEENGRYYLQKEPSLRLQILDCGLAGSPVFSAQEFFAQNKTALPWRIL